MMFLRCLECSAVIPSPDDTARGCELHPGSTVEIVPSPKMGRRARPVSGAAAVSAPVAAVGSAPVGPCLPAP